MIKDVTSGLARTPVIRAAIGRWGPPPGLDQAVARASDLADAGMWISLDGGSSPPTADVVDRLVVAGLSGVAQIWLSDAAREALTPVAWDRLRVHAESMGVQIDVDVEIDAALRRSEADCVRLSAQSVRLVRGSCRGRVEPAFSQAREADKSFVRCAKTLLAGAGEPSFATEDERLIDIVEALAVRFGRRHGSYEFAFGLGRSEPTQRRLAAAGERVRVRVPYGPG